MNRRPKKEKSFEHAADNSNISTNTIPSHSAIYTAPMGPTQPPHPNEQVATKGPTPSITTTSTVSTIRSIQIEALTSTGETTPVALPVIREKRGRGRPRKNGPPVNFTHPIPFGKIVSQTGTITTACDGHVVSNDKPTAKRGRKPSSGGKSKTKVTHHDVSVESIGCVKRGRGRPRKVAKAAEVAAVTV
jgi:hypothetical protein